MNAVTQTETRAIETAAPLEVADPSKNLILVPLSQLLPRRSKRNARKTPRLSIPELAASIARIGLLQNLVVILAADGEQYEVVAGDRRLTALKLLAKKKRIPADYEVACLLVPDASARTVSLAENLLREQMHPADQFAHALQGAVHLRHHVHAVDQHALAQRPAQRRVQRRAPLRGVDLRAIEQRRDGLGQAGLAGQFDQQAAGAHVDQVLRIVEEQAAVIQREAREALRVVGEGLAQAETLQCLALLAQCLPAGQLGDVLRGRGVGHRAILSQRAAR